MGVWTVDYYREAAILPCLSPLSTTHACATYWTSHCDSDACLNRLSPLIVVGYFHVAERNSLSILKIDSY